MGSESKSKTPIKSKPATKSELNSWRRGFTYQAEIWNGRLAIFGLIMLSLILFSANFFTK